MILRTTTTATPSFVSTGGTVLVYYDRSGSSRASAGFSISYFAGFCDDNDGIITVRANSGSFQSGNGSPYLLYYWVYYYMLVLIVMKISK